MQKGKLLTWIVLVFMVAVVPFGSWYYLRMGLNYRIDARNALMPKDSLDMTIDSLGLLKNKTTIVAMKGQSTSDVNMKLKSQFEKIEGFQLMVLDSALTSLNPAVFNKYPDADFLLIDNKGKLRNSYKADIESVKMLIQHTAITIPTPKELDIKIQKDGN